MFNATQAKQNVLKFEENRSSSKFLTTLNQALTKIKEASMNGATFVDIETTSSENLNSLIINKLKELEFKVSTLNWAFFRVSWL